MNNKIISAGVAGAALVVGLAVNDNNHKRFDYDAIKVEKPENTLTLSPKDFAAEMAQKDSKGVYAIVYRPKGALNFTEQTNREDTTFVPQPEAVKFAVVKAGSAVKVVDNSVTINGQTTATELPPTIVAVRERQGNIPYSWDKPHDIYSAVNANLKYALSREGFVSGQDGMSGHTYADTKVNEMVTAIDKVAYGETDRLGEIAHPTRKSIAHHHRKISDLHQSQKSLAMEARSTNHR